jgi:hypothetical protein
MGTLPKTQEWGHYRMWTLSLINGMAPEAGNTIYEHVSPARIQSPAP